MIGRKQEDRVEGRVVVAFFRRKSRKRLVPMTKTHHGMMVKLYEAKCIVEVPFRMREP